MKQGFDDLYGYNFIEIARKVNVLTNKELEHLDITFPQYRVVSQLWLEGELTQKDLHEYLTLAPATLTPIIKLLEKKNWITRNVDENDGRAKKIKLTETGIEVRNKAFEVIMKIENQLFRQLPKEENQLFLKWLKELNKGIQ